MRRFTILPEAAEDTRRSVLWYKMRSVPAGENFLKALGDGYMRIQASPNSYPLVRGRTRSLPLVRFPFRIYYEVTEDEILVLRVFHLKRDRKTLFKRRR